MSFTTLPIANAPFTSFAFPATGGSASRTLPDRLAEAHNVKDFGAVGNGTTDDTSAIQAAVNAASSNFVGRVFFPPGTYKVSATINLPYASAEGSFIIEGCGQASKVQLTSGFNGYAFQRLCNSGNVGPFNANGAVFIFRDLAIIGNAATTTNKGIQLQGAVSGYIRGMTFQSLHRAVWMDVSCFNMAISDCDFRGAGLPIASGSIGIISTCTAAEITGGAGGAQATKLDNCTVVNFDIGWLGPGTIINSRFEANNTGVLCGQDVDGGDLAGGLTIVGTGFEANRTEAIYLAHGAIAIFECNIDASLSQTNGFRFGYSDRVVCVGMNVAGNITNGGIVGDSLGQDPLDATFISCTSNVTSGGGDDWILPTHKAGMTCIQCNNPTMAQTFAELPGQSVWTGTSLATAVEGMEYDITDGAKSGGGTATWGDAVQGGGSQHLKVRYNGTNWTAVGK